MLAWRRAVAIGLLSVALHGCGGGGGTSTPDADAPSTLEQQPPASDAELPLASAPEPEAEPEPPTEPEPAPIPEPEPEAPPEDITEPESGPADESTPDVAEVTEPAPLPENQALACLSPERVEEIRADVARINDVFLSCDADLIAITAQLDLTLAQRQATFAMIVSHAMAPYGHSGATSLAALLADSVLDCDNYGRLTGYLMIALGLPMDTWLMAGFDGGAVGNHAQVLTTLDGRTLLLDPTIGLVVDISYDELVSGTPIGVERMAWTYLWDDPEILTYSERVISAIRDGLYQAADQYYLLDQSLLQ